MNKLKYVSITIFLAAAVILGVYVFREKAGEDHGDPVITIDGETVEVSVNDGEEALLQGVTAADAEGNDITDSVVVESLGPFTAFGRRTVTYAVVDADNSVAHAQRELIYTDYTDPQFRLDKPLSFSVDWMTLTREIHATDCLEGDITDRVRLVSEEGIDVSVPGNYSAELRVTDSTGREFTLPVTVEIYENAVRSSMPWITLTENIVYIPKGTTFDPTQYLSYVTVKGTRYSFTNGTGTYGTDFVDVNGEQNTVNYSLAGIKSDVNTAAPGNYRVVYTFSDTESGTGSAILYVVVTEGGTR